jgi:hypothetical protein
MQGEPNRGLRFGGPGEPAEPLRLALSELKLHYRTLGRPVRDALPCVR